MVKGWGALEGIPGKQCQWLGASRVLPEMGMAVGADALLNEIPCARARALTVCPKTGKCHSDEPQAVPNEVRRKLVAPYFQSDIPRCARE